MNEKRNIGGLFDRIAGRYDMLNHLLSFGIDKYWRRKAVASIVKSNNNNQTNAQVSNDRISNILDVAIGTGDLSIEMVRQMKNVSIQGIDLSKQMMQIGEEKVRRLGLQDKVQFMEASALNMPFEEESFDIVTCAYGVRNFSNLRQGLKEMQRVLKPEGELMILEFSYPDNKFIAWCYDLYFSHILPIVGRMVSHDKTAYSYLNCSVKDFIWGEAMCKQISEAGFVNVKYHLLTLGITTIYTATK